MPGAPDLNFTARIGRATAQEINVGTLTELTSLNRQGAITRAFADGSRWTWEAAGTPNGGTVVAAAGGGVWVREFTGPVFPRWWGAHADGVTNDASAFQAALNYSALHGNPVDGENRHYCLSRTLLDSNTTLKRAHIWADAAGGGQNQRSPLTIDGRYHGPLPRTRALMESARKHNIVLEDVHVNGRREMMLDCDGPEDGGRSGLMIYGRASNITVRRSSFNYCATDGVMLFSDTGASSASTIEAERVCVGDPAFININFEDVDCLWNRRCGVSWDAVDGFRWSNRYRWNSNGLDLPGIDPGTPLSAGSRGARLGGNLYAQGGDGEGYGVGARCTNIYLGPLGEALGNARQGIMLLPDDVEHDHPTFQPWDTIEIHTTVDQGLHSDEQAAVTLTGNRVAEADLIGRPLFTNVIMRPNLRGGFIQAKGAMGVFHPSGFTGAGLGIPFPVALIHSGGIIRNPDDAADNVRPEVVLATPGTRFQGRVPHLGFPALTFADGAAVTFASSAAVIVARLDGINRVRLTLQATVTGASSANPVERRSFVRWVVPAGLRIVSQRWSVASNDDLSLSPTLPAPNRHEYQIIWTRNGSHAVVAELDMELVMP